MPLSSCLKLTLLQCSVWKKKYKGTGLVTEVRFRLSSVFAHIGGQIEVWEPQGLHMIFQLLSRWYMWWWFCFEIFILFSSSAEISTQSAITFHYRHSKLDNLTIPGSEWHPCVWSHVLMWVPEFGFVYWHHPLHCKSIDTKCGDDSVSCASETWSVHLYISIFYGL